MIRPPTLAACAVLLAAAGPAHAAGSGDRPSFESLDKNADSRISVNEASEHDALFVAFKNLDRDKDGMLTREEFSAFRRDRA